MNFRIDLPNDEVRSLVEQKNYHKLQERDQLLMVQKQHPILKNYSEGPLLFDPTYRYDFDSNLYDTSKKNRIPAWTDRILMCRDPQFRRSLVKDKYNKDDNAAAMPAFYHRKESYFSDHRPVLAVYRLQVIRIHRDKKDALRQEILNKLIGQDRVSKETLAKMDSVLTDEFNQVLSQTNSNKQSFIDDYKAETVEDLLNFDDKPPLMNRAWDPSMMVKQKKGKEEPVQAAQAQSNDADLLGLFDNNN